jgi:hypothetical protein
VPVLVCHDDVVVECDEDRGEEAKRWLEKAMVVNVSKVVGLGFQLLREHPC